MHAHAHAPMCMNIHANAHAHVHAHAHAHVHAHAHAHVTFYWVLLDSQSALIGCSFRRKTTDTTKHAGADHMASR